MSRNSADRLRDILDCIRKARPADGLRRPDDELGDRDLVETAFAAVEGSLFVIGDAAKGPRDELGHEYFRIVPKIVRATSGRTSTRWRLP